MTENPNQTEPTLPPPAASPPATSPPAGDQTPARSRLRGTTGVVAVGAAALVLGGLGGTALGFALDDPGRGDFPARVGHPGPGFGMHGPMGGQWDDRMDDRMDDRRDGWMGR